MTKKKKKNCQLLPHLKLAIFVQNVGTGVGHGSPLTETVNKDPVNESGLTASHVCGVKPHSIYNSLRAAYLLIISG